jgi:conjugal transfer pilus assembly protein TraW
MKKIFLTILAATSFCAQSENLGVHGQTYSPDRDGREQFKDVIRQKQKSGEIDKFWKDYQAKSIDSIKHPAPLGIKSDYRQRSELRELKFTFPKDVRDQRGKPIVKAGTVIEPLKIQPLVSGLIFIDGRDQRQVDYAIARGRAEPLKIVLTAGSPYDLRVKYQKQPWYGGSQTIPFYFDQRKMIITSLQRLYGINVNTVPVVLTQRGEKLAVEYGVARP